ncbi:Ig-like domain-containing protein [Plantibacter sp. VKM Ac-2885]|uniref:OmpL47-type beta-barrel domain-containing protein n=1 Tax=Plantibacter sp. VKM Ac-2885 TaxID=2783828 RepID=UPI00351C366E
MVRTQQSTPKRGSRGWRGGIAATAALAVIGTTFLTAPAQAANADIGYPTFSGSDTPVPATGTGYTAGNQLQAIFDADVAAGAGALGGPDFWMDRMLQRTGTTGSFGDDNQWLFSRGRAVFMKEHDPSKLGFGGQVAYWEAIDGKAAYTVAAKIDGSDVTLTEDTASRVQTPSYWRSVHRHAASGIEVVQTKYITDGNVAVTGLQVRSTNGAHTVQLTASSAYTTTVEGDELTGVVSAANKLTTIFPRLSGDGFTPDGGGITASLAVPAGGTVSTKVQLGFVTDEIAESRTQYDAVRGLAPDASYTAQVTAYNQWWADNVPYLDTPEDNIDKTLYYRWWLMRFNFLDADIPGNDYQFPTSMEGVLGYNNAIVLTTGMFIDDLKYFRNPIYSYGPWVSAGETSKSYKFVDNPGDPANWSNSYTQYISEAAWRSYQLHGGPTAIAENLAEYAEDDVKGLLDAYDTDDSGLIDYNWGAMTGNDADAVSFHERPNAYMDRTENAYLYSNALASAAAYRTAGNEAKAVEMDEFAQGIKDKVVELLWDADAKVLKHRFTSDGKLAKWKEINNFYPFTVGLMPKPGDADYADDYVKALDLFADDAQYPIFPFYTANQADQADYGGPGSNNFSVINSTVTFRMLAKVLRDYPTKAIDAEWYKKLLYWNAWSHYQNGGDNRLPDQNEFWSDGDADPQDIGYRSWIHHTILGATNFTMIEDTMGLRPRSDAKIELDPIDIDWDHFTANNIAFRDQDLTITWDAPGGERHYGDSIPEGYSVFLDGKLAFTIDSLSKVVYDPATGTVEVADDVTVLSSTTASLQAPQDVSFAAGDRVVDLFAKAGADVDPASAGSANAAEGAEVSASFSAPSRPATAAVDGTTANEPFWGTAGSPNAKDSLVVELGGTKTFDDARVYFYNSSSTATVQGYSEPATYSLEVRNGDTWTAIPAQARGPVYPRANYNHVQFPEVTGDAVRLTVNHAAGFKTGVKELQLFATGVAAPASTNQAPSVNAWVDQANSAGGTLALVGEVKDDGLPLGDVTSAWSVVDAPDDGLVIFGDATAASTTASFTAEGSYTLRLTASDGELTSTKDLVVQGAASAGGQNVAREATPTGEFTAGWNSVNAVNDGTVLHSGGSQADVWGTWSGSRPATRWLQYDWATPVRVDAATVSFWGDQTDPSSGAGVNVPKSWKAQYWTGDAWADVTGASAYGVERDAPNAVDFDAVTTTKLRLVLSAAGPGTGADPYAGVAVSEWEVFAVAPTAIEPIDVRTTTGVVPTLPSTVDATFADGSHADLPVSWASITPEQVAGEGSFSVVGLVTGSAVPAKATVWVRATAPGQINAVDPVAVTTAAGVAPALPTSLGVLYNDGSREDLPVMWATVDPSSYAAEGVFEVAGTVESALPGAKSATATVTVGAGGGEEDDTVPVVALTADPAAPASGWHTGAATVSVTATDDLDSAPVVEVSVDDAAWAPYTGPIAVSGDGVHTVAARATDATGNRSASSDVTVRIDATAPSVTPVADAAARTVKATATDAGSGLASIEVRIGDAAEWTPYAKAVLVGLEETKVHLRATDTAGNVSADTTVVVPKSDGQLRRNVAIGAVPTASFTAAWNTVDGLNDDVAPTSSGDVTPNDNATVWGAWPEIGQQWVQYDWAEAVTVGETGAYFVSNLDDAGLGIEVPTSWKAQYWDAEAGDGAGAWVDVEALGAYGTEVDAFNPVAFTPVTTTKLRLLLEASGAESGKGSLGIKEWQVFEAADQPVPDVTAPVVTTTVTPELPASGWFREDVSVSATALDDRDLVATLEARVGTGEWVAYTGPVVVTADGVTTVSFRGTDAAGNVSEPSVVEVRRDATVPTPAGTFDGTARTVTVTAEDQHSGVAFTEVRIGDGAWTTYTAPVATGDAATTVAVRATDVAGNVSESVSVDVPAKPVTPEPTPTPVDPTPTPGPSEPSGSLTGDEVLRLGVTSVAPGGALPVSLTGAQPGAVFRVELRSTPVTLGTLTVGADGTANAVFTVPYTITAGVHTLALVLPGGEVTAQVTVITPGASTPDAIASTGVPEEAATFGRLASLAVLLGAAAVLIARQRAGRTQLERGPTGPLV